MQSVYKKNLDLLKTGTTWNRWVMMTFPLLTPASKKWLGWGKRENAQRDHGYCDITIRELTLNPKSCIWRVKTAWFDLICDSHTSILFYVMCSVTGEVVEKLAEICISLSHFTLFNKHHNSLSTQEKISWLSKLWTERHSVLKTIKFLRGVYIVNVTESAAYGIIFTSC